MSTLVNRRTALAFAVSAAGAALFLAVAVGPFDDDSSTVRTRAGLMAVDPPQLWRAETQRTAGEPAAATYICADTPLAQTFTRVLAEVNGEPCRVSQPPILRTHEFVARCEAAGRPFAVASTTAGDLSRDFRLNLAVAALDTPGGAPARQSLRYVKLGPCPAGWTIGQQARSPAPLTGPG